MRGKRREAEAGKRSEARLGYDVPARTPIPRPPPNIGPVTVLRFGGEVWEGLSHFENGRFLLWVRKNSGAPPKEAA